jgi:hypothetical protein
VDSSYLHNQDEGVNVIVSALCSSASLLTDTFSTSEFTTLHVNYKIIVR